MLTRLEELRILYRLLGEARDMLMAKPWLVAVWQDVAGPPFGHLSALRFLLQSRVLPDHRVSEGCLAYPYTAFQTWYLQDKSDQGRKLLVDVVLVEADFRQAADPRSPLQEGFPPPSIYLIPSLEPWTPHVVTYYLLLNISATIFHDYRPVKEKLKCFPSPFHLSTDVQSLVEDIWHLDHGNHEERVECLQQAQQQASAALRPLLDALWAPAVRPLLQCQPPLALRSPDHLQVAFEPEQMTLQLDVLLANCRVIDAVELVHWHGHLTSQEQLLGCVMALTRKLNVWEARDQLELILQVPLSAADKEQLVNFCKLVDKTCMYHVVLHLLQSGHSHAALPLTGCLQELFREAKTQRSHLPEVRRKVSVTVANLQSFVWSMPLPASQLNAAPRRRDQSRAPVQYLGPVLRKGNTACVTTQITSLRVAIYVVEASKPPAMPSAHDRVAQSELYVSMYTPAVGHYTPQSRLEGDAASMLCTPHVILWEGHSRQTTYATQPSKSVLASILKRRPVDLPSVVASPVLPRGSGEEHAGACLTPTELGEDFQLIPADPSDQRLRFVISDSNSSQATHELDSTAQSLGGSSLLSPPVEQGGRSKETEITSDRSSLFVTPTDSASTTLALICKTALRGHFALHSRLLSSLVPICSILPVWSLLPVPRPEVPTGMQLGTRHQNLDPVRHLPSNARPCCQSSRFKRLPGACTRPLQPFLLLPGLLSQKPKSHCLSQRLQLQYQALQIVRRRRMKRT
ncbi:hypothetical protein V5799_009659 [Amblyomma americanum]|uniref:ELYS-like domain-containing protein n=1 Tax=Amblyomma americanum TaxID=6943 RepID=A0AAQ4FB17_AMBAM